MPPPITSTLAPRGIGYISSPDRQHAAGSVSAAVTGSSPRGRGCSAATGSATRSAKPPTRVAPRALRDPALGAFRALAAPVGRLAARPLCPPGGG